MFCESIEFGDYDNDNDCASDLWPRPNGEGWDPEDRAARQDEPFQAGLIL